MGFRLWRRARIFHGFYFTGTRLAFSIPGSGRSDRSPAKPWTERLRSGTRPARFNAAPRLFPIARPAPSRSEADLTLQDLALPWVQPTPPKRWRGIGFLFIASISIAAACLVALTALDEPMRAQTSTMPAPRDMSALDVARTAATPEALSTREAEAKANTPAPLSTLEAEVQANTPAPSVSRPPLRLHHRP